MDILEESRPVLFGDVDRSDRLTPASAFDFFQEAAINHAEALGVGREAMAAAGRVWILSRISVLMENRPRWRDRIRVRSWPRGWEKLFAIRDYDMLDGAGRPLVRGRSGWLVLDMDKRRPLRPQTVMEGMPPNDGLDALPGGPLGLAVREGLVLAAERRAAYSDIDYNGHVNNARYVQWIQDVCDPAVLEGAGCIRLDINYLNEVRFGELTGLWMGEVSPEPGSGFGRAFVFEGRREGAAVFRAELRTGGQGV